MLKSTNVTAENEPIAKQQTGLTASRRALAGSRNLDSNDLLTLLLGSALPLPSLTLRRATADMAGLWQRHHDLLIAQQLKQHLGDHQSLLWIEWLRIEALGAQQLNGLRANTAVLFDFLLTQQEGGIIGRLLELLLPLRRSLNNLTCGLVTADVDVEIVLTADESKHLNQLITDQSAFAEAAFIALNFDSTGVCNSNISTVTQSAEIPEQDPFSEEENNQQQADPDIEYDEQAIEAASQPIPENNHAFSGDYRIFSTHYDRQIDANEYARQQGLSYPETQDDHRQLVSRLANRLQRRIQALQRRQWEHDLDDGRLDPGRLARVVVSPLSARPYKKEQESLFKETAITLLVDNSGSMKGESSHIAYQSCSIIAQSLERCGIKVEVLGFTTAQHNQPLLDWQAAGRPEQPGRLNALRHIVYKAADCKFRRARGGLSLMLNESWLQENIDGEALLWAYQRLLARREPRRILLTISDGKPMDQPTLRENDQRMLEQHLHQVIKGIEQDDRVELAAIGIGHDIARYYANAITIYNTKELGEVLLKQLEQLFLR
ncbi:MAG: hypothetical protein V7735_21115 [Photobacterium frigidiphilum]|uniref:cobaltochelatase CobT-related protein n=1 Tax=Photobacterium frigidiphilum TaxID=264736 RepID=UPI003003749E